MLLDPYDAGEDHLRLFRDILLFIFPGAAAAGAAVVRVLLAEIFQHPAPKACPGLAVGDHRLQPLIILLLDLSYCRTHFQSRNKQYFLLAYREFFD